MQDPSSVVLTLISALLAVNRVEAERILADSFEERGLDGVAGELIAPALEKIGNDWVDGKTSLSEVYMSSRICEEWVNTVLPKHGARKAGHPKMAIVALQDYHLLGKKLVQLTLHSFGYEILDYGQGVSVKDLVDRVRKDGIEILLISTLMLASALKVREVRRELDSLGFHVKIVVGGAPYRFDAQLWKEVGADAMGVTASDALKIIKTLTEERARAA